MSKVKGVLLVVAGLGVAAYVLSSRAELTRKAPTEPAAAAKSAPVAGVNLAVVAERRRIDPPRAEPATPAPEPRPEGLAARDWKPSSPPAAAPPSQPWPPFVSRVEPDRAPPRLPLPAAQRSNGLPPDRFALARDLQRELRRVGCYDGEINGMWTTSTRRAMKMFTDRVNATLPLDEPDHVLLALVRNNPDNVCDKPCPAGQGLSEAGRCLPNALLARAATRGASQPSAGTAPRAMVPEPPPAIVIGRSTTTPMEPAPDGRMALAGPRLDGRPPSPAVPMPSEGVSLLAGPDAAATEPPGSRAQRQAGKPPKSAWARSFWRRRDTAF